MLEGNVSIPSLDVAYAIIEPSTKEELAKLHAKFAAEVIAVFDESIS